MADLLTTGSVMAAFFAGGVALFAPCCIVFLAPSYLAVAVKNRRWRLLPLTFIFAAGLGLVLIPITLGVSLVAGTIANYHEPLYYAGGVLMLALAVFTLSGRMVSLPSFVRAPDTTRGDSASFFALGVFSGLASSCCAPVLVGVMTPTRTGAQQLLASPENTPRAKKLAESPRVVSGARTNEGRLTIRPDRVNTARASISTPPA